MGTSNSTSQRLVSLDAFRGATIAGMILVNNPGSWSDIYPQLRHAAWNGWTFTDFIFPFFLWIVGVAMTFSFSKRIAAGDHKRQLMLHVLWRAIVIFGLGLFLTGFPFGLAFGHNFSWAAIRIPGVLQRIAVCYLIVSAIVLYAKPLIQGLFIPVLLVGYWLLVKMVPVPGYGAGIMDPTGSLCWYVDSTVLAGHTWSGAPVPGFDPEGIVSTIPAIASTLFGVMTGHFIRSQRTPEVKTAWMFFTGMVFLLLGAILDMWLPINKNLWTSSYSVFMAGWALVCLACFYWLIDVQGYKKWAQPFVIYGMNAIAAFVLSGFIGKLLYLIKFTGADGQVITLKTIIYQSWFTPYFSSINASLAFAIFFNLVMFAIAWMMWKKKWFLKV
jgi:predicted acyltransferase